MPSQLPSQLSGKILRVLILLILALPVLVAGWWTFLLMTSKSQITNNVIYLQGKGFQIDYAPIVVRGFPFELTLEAANVSIIAPAEYGNWTIKTATVLVTSKLHQPGIINVELPAPSVVNRTGLKMGTATVRRLRASIQLENSGVKSVSSQLFDATWTNGPALPSRIKDLQIRFSIPAQTTQAAQPPARLTMDLTASDIRVSDQFPMIFGNDIRTVELTGTLYGTIDHTSGSTRQILHQWREGGGVIEIEQTLIENGPLRLRADGTLALDAALQPEGAFTAQVQGFPETLQALTEKRMIGPREAMLARVVLGVLAKPSPENNRPTIEMPLTLQGQKLYAGPIALLDIPTINYF